jgi:hypothetical protein
MNPLNFHFQNYNLCSNFSSAVKFGMFNKSFSYFRLTGNNDSVSLSNLSAKNIGKIYDTYLPDIAKNISLPSANKPYALQNVVSQAPYGVKSQSVLGEKTRELTQELAQAKTNSALSGKISAKMGLDGLADKQAANKLKFTHVILCLPNKDYVPNLANDSVENGVGRFDFFVGTEGKVLRLITSNPHMIAAFQQRKDR